MARNPAQPATPAEQMHQEIMRELDEIKRYVAGVYSKVDTEIDDIRSKVDRINSQLRESDSQIDKIERFDRDLRNIEKAINNLERKLK